MKIELQGMKSCVQQIKAWHLDDFIVQQYPYLSLLMSPTEFNVQVHWTAQLADKRNKNSTEADSIPEGEKLYAENDSLKDVRTYFLQAQGK